MGVGGQRHAPAAFSPGKTRYPLYRRLGGPQGWSGRGQKISPPPGFDPRTVQLVASRYTDWYRTYINFIKVKNKELHKKITQVCKFIWSFINVFTSHFFIYRKFTNALISSFTWHWKTEWLVNNVLESTWKETVVTPLEGSNMESACRN